LQGASAIQQLLVEFRGQPLRAFIIWEPVLDSDAQPPSPRALARITDRRASQYWDPHLHVASAAGPVLQRDPAPVIGKESLVAGEIVWDFAGVYAPGIEWRNTFPVPDLKAAPVADAFDALRARLRRAR
jgi:hypothetical protein